MSRVLTAAVSLSVALGLALLFATTTGAQPRVGGRRNAGAALDAGAQRGADASAKADATDAATDAGATDAAASAATEPDAAEMIWASCQEHVPSEASRPKLVEQFPERALAGHAMALHVTVEHGKGEIVFPAGLQIQTSGDAARAMAEAGFVVPNADGGSGPSTRTRMEADHAVTDVVLSFVALPPKPGRYPMVLPPVPITLSRASGELVTVCTSPHRVLVEDPTSNEPEAMPKNNPPARAQRELWTLARDLTYGLLIGAAVAALATWLILRWLRRPKPILPPPPPRPAWETALSELNALRRSGLVAAGQGTELIDKTSDVVRRYLGGLYGFDGIESTTDEVLHTLRVRHTVSATMHAVTQHLRWCDLVKFARVTPTAEDCGRVLDEAEAVVHTTMPHAAGEQPPPVPTTAGGAS